MLNISGLWLRKGWAHIMCVIIRPSCPCESCPPPSLMQPPAKCLKAPSVVAFSVPVSVLAPGEGEGCNQFLGKDVSSKI